jgi:hypothetical protein
MRPADQVTAMDDETLALVSQLGFPLTANALRERLAQRRGSSATKRGDPMATNFDDLTQEQQAQVTARFTLGDPQAYVYGLGLGGDVLTRTPAPAEQPDLDGAAILSRLGQLPARKRRMALSAIDSLLAALEYEPPADS